MAGFALHHDIATAVSLHLLPRAAPRAIASPHPPASVRPSQCCRRRVYLKSLLAGRYLLPATATTAANTARSPALVLSRQRPVACALDAPRQPARLPPVCHPSRRRLSLHARCLRLRVRPPPEPPAVAPAPLHGRTRSPILNRLPVTLRPTSAPMSVPKLAF